jgi:hypothetical protein
MVNQREARITMDYLTGMSVTALAAREEVTAPRIYQVLHKVAYRVMGRSSITLIRPEDVPRFQARLYDSVFPHRPTFSQGEASTPREFFLELLSETKTRNY